MLVQQNEFEYKSNFTNEVRIFEKNEFNILSVIPFHFVVYTVPAAGIVIGLTVPTASDRKLDMDSGIQDIFSLVDVCGF